MARSPLWDIVGAAPTVAPWAGLPQRHSKRAPMTRRTLCFTALIALAACTPRTSGHHAKRPQPGSAPSSTARVDATPAAPVGPNPFEGVQFFRNPDYAKQVMATAAAHPEMAKQLEQVAAQPTAVWLDTIAAAQKVSEVLDVAAKQAGSDGKPVLTVFVVYDLPNRDCSAKASAGELSVEQNGEERYKKEFIDKIAEQFAAHPEQRIVAIIEPDSLPNLATNLNVPRCAQSDQVYRRSIAYAVSKLAAPNTALYLDAAHAGWLGWEGNRQKIAAIYKDVLTQAGGADKIRGFATNVSNYNTVDGGDGKKLGAANPCPDEGTYIRKLNQALEAQGLGGKRFLIDTARGGRVVRSTWGNWCNIKDAGLGPRPQASPSELIDAYYWVKPPGESDGTTDKASPRFDAGCLSADSMPGAPEAGKWFEAHFLEMVRHAEPAF